MYTNTLMYNKVTKPNKEDAMPESTLQGTDSDRDRLHASEPIMSRRSDVHGEIKVFPPSADPSEWPDRSWLITTSRTDIMVPIKSSAVTECFERPHFIGEQHLFE